MKRNYLGPAPLCLLVIATLYLQSCDTRERQKADPKEEQAAIENNELQFRATLDKHLTAINQRDLETLRSTLSPNGNMQLIMPGTEIIHNVTGFIQYYSDSTRASDWTLESKILYTEVGETMGMAIVEAIYATPKQDGKPDLDRMTVSYDLQKIDGYWYVIKNHASFVEKSVKNKN